MTGPLNRGPLKVPMRGGSRPAGRLLGRGGGGPASRTACLGATQLDPNPVTMSNTSKFTKGNNLPNAYTTEPIHWNLKFIHVLIPTAGGGGLSVWPLVPVGSLSTLSSTASSPRTAAWTRGESCHRVLPEL